MSHSRPVATTAFALCMVWACSGTPPQLNETRNHTAITASPPAPCAVVAVELSCPAPREVQRRATTDDSGVLLCESFCHVDGTPHGPVVSVRFEDPPLVTTGAYHMGRRTGPWDVRLKAADGPLRETITYLHGPRNGPYRTYHANGTPHVSGNYERDLEDGRWTLTSPDGINLEEQTFDRGRPVGTQIRRHLNGATASEQRYDEAGRPDGAWCSWLPDGTEIECTEFQDGTGTAKSFDGGGRLVNELHYVDGRKHGLERSIDGQRTVETTWTNGQQTGPQTEIADGCVEVERTLFEGRANGPYSAFHCGPSDSVEVESGSYCGGHFCGLWVKRDPTTGAIVRVAEYDQLSMKLAEAQFDGQQRLVDFWTVDESRRLRRAACYQALAGGLCCDPSNGDYTINTDCMPAADTTEL